MVRYTSLFDWFGVVYAHFMSFSPFYSFSANTFDVEWAEFSLLVRSLPQKNQQAVLSQMLIMTNGRTKSARFKLAKQVNKLIHQIAQEDAPSIPGMSNLKVNLQTFARLHREHRNLLSKRIFEAISQLYGDKEN